MLEQASEELQAVMRDFALSPNRPSKEVYESTLTQREELRKSVRSYFEAQGIMALAFPRILSAPLKIAEEIEVDVCGQNVPLTVAITRNISLGSCASMASLLLPAGITSDGLPVGMEFDALMGNDRQLLSFGLLFEQALGAIPGPRI
jgi:Asp-tRNA(Asn)/Glu-tRNA(Gln) amidotransferase A subunit family amidase